MALFKKKKLDVENTTTETAVKQEEQENPKTEDVEGVGSTEVEDGNESQVEDVDVGEELEEEIVAVEEVKEKPVLNDIDIAKDKRVIKDLADNVLTYFTMAQAKRFNNYKRGLESKENIQLEAERYLKDKKATRYQIREVMDLFNKFVFGYHILDDLIKNPDISDIKVVGTEDIRIKVKGKRRSSGLKFDSQGDLDKFISIIATKNQVNVSNVNAIQTFTDKDTFDDCILRITVLDDFVTSAGHSYMHIRKIPKQKMTKSQLIESGLVTPNQLDYLTEAVRMGKKIIFTGKGASGKTTMLNYLLDQIPEDRSAMVIQENEELFSGSHPDIMFLKVRMNNGEGKVQYSLKDLTIAGLLTDLDYFIVGEIKGDEALYFLNAAKTGHVCMGTVHGENSTEAVDKIVDYMKYASDYSRADLMKMLKSLDIIVYLESFKCKEISEIVGYDEQKEDLIYNTVYKDQKSTGLESKVVV